jgi:hypothetical protein
MRTTSPALMTSTSFRPAAGLRDSASRTSSRGTWPLRVARMPGSLTCSRRGRSRGRRLSRRRS